MHIPFRRSLRTYAIDPDQVEHARAVLGRVGPKWLGRAGVTGIDVGLRQRHGEVVDEVAIRVYVAEKRPRAAVDRTDLFPETESGVPVDVIEFRPREALSG